MTDTYTEIRDSFRGYFPQGWISTSNGCLGTGTVFVTFGMLPRADIPNGIQQNDPCHNMFRFDQGDDGLYEVEYCNGGLSVDPEPGSFMAMGTVKTRLRKRSGLTYDKLVKTIDNYFRKTSATVSLNADRIYGRDRYNLSL